MEVEEIGLGDEEEGVELDDAGSADARDEEVTCNETGRCSDDDDDDVEVDVLDAGCVADAAVGTTAQGMEGEEDALALAVGGNGSDCCGCSSALEEDWEHLLLAASLLDADVMVDPAPEYG